MRVRLAAALGALAGLSCRGPEAPGVDLVEDAAGAFTPCAPDEIRALALRQSLQLAFEPCGSNRFLGASWSPDGRLLAFLLPGGAYVLDGVAKEVVSVPGEVPTGPPAWLRQDLLAQALPPVEGEGGARIALVELRASTLDVLSLDLREPRDLQALNGQGELLFTALGDGQRWPYVLDATRQPRRAFAWLQAPVDRLDLGGGLVGFTDSGGATVAEAATGEVLARLPGVARAIPHPDGRYVALEVPGRPVSAFDQRPWGDGTSEAAAREAERQARWLERLPDHVPRTVVPPEIHVLDLDTGARWRLTAYQGDRLSWYPPRPDHASFLLWGVEGKQVNRNVALSDLLGRIRLVEAGMADPGVERVEGTVADD